jgi:hypothetical protein
MHLRTAPALEGVAWMRAGVTLLLRQPMAHLALMGFMFFAFGMLLGIQKIGPIAILILIPSLNAGWVACNAALREGKLLSPLNLLAPLRNSASRSKLLILGCLHAVASIAMLVLADLMDPDFHQHWSAALREQPATDDALSEAAFHGLQSGMVLRLLCLLPVALLFWHAPVILHRLPKTSVAKALFASGLASLRNIKPFAIYLVSWVLADLILSLLIGVLLSLFGAGSGLAVFVLVPVMLLFAGAFYTSMHASVHGCLLFDEIPSETPV